MRKTLTVGAVTTAMLAGMCAIPASATALPAQQLAAKPKTKPAGSVIIAPRAGQKVKRHTVKVTVRAPYGVRAARLNGTRLTNREFRLAPNGKRRTLVASSSHGLRHGTNTLRVTVNKRYKGTKTQTLRFTIQGKPVLTGAGRDKRVAAGTSVNIKGTSRLHPSVPKNARASFRWTIVSKPAGSDATLRHETKRKPRLKTDMPGKYVLRVKSSYGRNAAAGTLTSDTVTVSAPQTPMVPFNAFSADGAGILGVSVAGHFYPDSLPLQDASWQMVVFNRTTMGVDEGDNRAYGKCGDGWCRATDGGGPSKPVDLAEELEELGPEELVVLVHREQYGQAADLSDFRKVMNIPAAAVPAPGEVAAIVVVPGENGGVRSYMHEVAGKADMSGYMLQDRYFNYTFVDDERVPFDTRAAQSCDSASCTATVELGGTKRSYTVKDGQAGIVISRFDRRTLAFRDAQFVLTRGQYGDQTKANMLATAKYLNSLPKDDLVVITSLAAPGEPILSRPTPILEKNDDEDLVMTGDPATRLGSAIARFGGTRHRFLQAGIQADDGYTMIGYPGLDEGQADEAHAKDARLTGALQRDASQIFTTHNVTQAPEPVDKLVSTVMSTPNTLAWPGQDDPKFRQVLSCLAADKPNLNQSDPRKSYWNNSKQISASDWTNWAAQVKTAKPEDCPGTDAGVFAQARDQFVRELRLNGYLRSYINDMKDPFSNSAAISQLANLNKWASDLKASSDEIKSKGVKIDWFALIATAIEAVAPFLAPYLEGQAGKKIVESLTHALAVAIAGSLEYTGSYLESEETGDKYLEDDEFTAEVGKLGAEVVDRLQTTAANFDRMGDVIASDYSKLTRIGNELIDCKKEKDAGRAPGDKTFDCDASFYSDNITLAKAEATASHTAERTIYEAILPLTYPVTNLPWDGKITQGYGRPEGNWDATLFTCFNATPFPQSWPAGSKPFLRRSVGLQIDQDLAFDSAAGQRPGVKIPQFDTYVIAAFGNDRFNVDTAEKAVSRLFGKVTDSTDPADGGLGADPVDFVLTQRAEGKIKDYPLGCGGFENKNPVPAPQDR